MVSLLRASLLALAVLLVLGAPPAHAQADLADTPTSDDAPRPAVLRGDAPADPLAARLRDARDFAVSGVVRGADDRQTLPGVNVLIKGTGIGVATGMDGEYALTAPTELDTLVFSYIGYETQEVPIIGRSEINIELRPQGYGGDEVVVIGYGSREVRDLTGSVGAVTTDEIEGKALTSFEDAIAGRIAGVQVQQNSGDQIGNFSVDIRGVGSFSGSNRPLYVVDGIPLESTDIAFLSTLNTEDIESISVLKDASSASIYGTRAADGVVIITTKTGAGQEPQIRLSAFTGVSTPVSQIEVLNSEQLAQFRFESVRNSQGANPRFELPAPLQDAAFLAANDVDWQDVLTRDALQQSYNINALGSNGPFQYSASGGFETDEGTLIGTDLSKASIRLNAVTQLSTKATLDVRMTGARQWGAVTQNDQTFGASFRDGLYKYPWEVPYNADGSFAEYDTSDPEFGQIYSGAFPQNPAADILENSRDRQWQQFIGNVAFTYQLPLSLRYRGSGSANISRNRADDFFPTRDRVRQLRETINVRSFDQSGFNYFTDHTLTFDREVGPHDIEVLGGMSFQENYLEFTFISAGGGTNNGQRAISLQPEIISASGARQQSQVLLSLLLARRLRLQRQVLRHADRPPRRLVEVRARQQVGRLPGRLAGVARQLGAVSQRQPLHRRPPPPGQLRRAGRQKRGRQRVPQPRRLRVHRLRGHPDALGRHLEHRHAGPPVGDRPPVRPRHGPDPAKRSTRADGRRLSPRDRRRPRQPEHAASLPRR